MSTIDAASFTRLAEIDDYARRRGVDRAEAIRELVNAALSHGLDRAPSVLDHWFAFCQDCLWTKDADTHLKIAVHAERHIVGMAHQVTIRKGSR